MRKSHSKKSFAVITFLTFFCSVSSYAGSSMTYIYNGPETALDKRYAFHWEILKTALEKTVPKYGPYRMFQSKSMTEQRQAYELENSTGKLTVMCLGSTPDREKKLVPVRIPVDKNLNGYELFLIRKEDKNRFKDVKTMENLKKFTFGLGLGWIDTDVLRNNGFTVVTGSNYNGLFEMLLNRRFDVFLRSADEILGEFENRKGKMTGLMIEDSILINYTLPMYFWFSKTAGGKSLAKRAEAGMRIMIEDGTYDRIFAKHEENKIKKLNLKGRKIFRLANPFSAPETPLEDKKLWFDPQTFVFTTNLK